MVWNTFQQQISLVYSYIEDFKLITVAKVTLLIAETKAIKLIRTTCVCSDSLAHLCTGFIERKWVLYVFSTSY